MHYHVGWEHISKTCMAHTPGHKEEVTRANPLSRSQANKPKSDKWWCKSAGVAKIQFNQINTVISIFIPGCVTNQCKVYTALLESAATLSFLHDSSKTSTHTAISKIPHLPKWSNHGNNWNANSPITQHSKSCKNSIMCPKHPQQLGCSQFPMWHKLWSNLQQKYGYHQYVDGRTHKMASGSLPLQMW